MSKSNQKSVVSKVIIVFMILLVVSGVSLYSYYKSALKPVDTSDSETVDLEIPAGSSSKSIGKILEDRGLIKNRTVFLLKVKSLDNGSSLKAGNYKMSKSMDLETIMSALIKGGTSGNTVRFTIPEGYEIKDIAKKLSNEEIIDLEKFLELTSDKKNFEEEFTFLKELKEGQSLEGFLFPSTYDVYEDHSEEDIIKKMLNGFAAVYKRDIKDNLKNTEFDLNELITLASIVEREGKLDSERAKISGVFYNRIEIGMRLQSCATVQYILGERKEVLTNAETSIDSPFNTYVNAGLPPAPIASPGEKSLLAAINPEDVDYLFFTLTGADGSHTFTKNYNDHLNAAPKK